MLAIEIAQPGGPEVLRPVTRETPVPSAGEVLIRVQAADAHRLLESGEIIGKIVLTT